jgi:FkbM family methyltransferase
MSKHLARLIDGFARAATACLGRNRRLLTLALASERLRPVAVVTTGGKELRFDCPTARALHDPLAFHTGEPETLRWIDRHVRSGEVVWDIGANIGVYSLYAGLGPDVTVVAFEPSAASFAALVRNIEMNGLGARVHAYCLALSDRTGADFLHMAATGAGHSMHAFGQLETVGGRLDPVFSQAVPGVTIDDACALFHLPAPDHVKLDVDSIEVKILRGGVRTLARVRSVAMEVTGESGAVAADFLRQCGFETEARHGAQPRNEIFLNRSLPS